MKLAIFTSQGWAQTVLPALENAGHEVVLVCGTRPKPLAAARSQLAGWRRRIRAAVFDDGPLFGRNPFEDWLHPHRWARLRGVPWMDAGPQAWAQADMLDRLREADLALVCGFPYILPPSVFRVPGCGTVNIHPSLLPRRRGATPSRWVLFYGDRQAGVTAHHLNEAIDAGNILAQHRLNVSENDTWETLESRLMRAAGELAVEVCGLFNAGIPEGTVQDPVEAGYDKPFRQAHSVIRWQAGTELILRAHRAAYPKWGAIFGLQDRLMSTWRIERFLTRPDAAAGTVIAVNPSGSIDISAADGVIRIHEVINPGGVITAARSAGDESATLGTVCDSAEAVSERLGVNAASIDGYWNIKAGQMKGRPQ